MRVNRALRVGWAVAVIGLGALALGACGGDGEPDATRVIARGQPITIGVSTMVQGELATLGGSLRDAAQLAGDGVYIAGHPIRFVTVNDGCNRLGGERAARALVSLDVVAVVGPSCSGAVLGSQPGYEAAGVTQISQLSTNPATTHPEGREPFRTFLRTAFNDDVQGVEQADFAQNTLKVADVFIAFEAFRYGGAVDQFRAAFTGKVVGEAGFEADGVEAAAKAAAAAKPSLVYFSGFFDTGVPFIRALRAAGYAGPVLGGDAIFDPAVISGLGALAEPGLYVTLPSPPAQGVAYNAFVAKYTARYRADPHGTAFLAESYDAATVILTALQAPGVAEDRDGVLHINLARLNAAIHKVEIAGASGRVAFDERGDRQAEGLDPVTIFTVKDGRFVIVPR